MAIQEIEYYVPIKYNPYVEERYEVSTLGHIRNRKTGHVLINQWRRQNGYASICLQIGNGKQVTFYVHAINLSPDISHIFKYEKEHIDEKGNSLYDVFIRKVQFHRNWLSHMFESKISQHFSGTEIDLASRKLKFLFRLLLL